MNIYFKSKLLRSEGLKPIPLSGLKMREGWEDAPLLPQNGADFQNYIPAHYLIQYELLGGNKMEIGNGCFGVVYTSVVNTDDIPVIRSEINEKQRVALKVGRVESANQEEQQMALDSLFKELKIMMKVNTRICLELFQLNFSPFLVDASRRIFKRSCPKSQF